MRVPFIKMHGLGNDFVVLDARNDPLPAAMTAARAAALADRHTGIGCDQLIVLAPAGDAGADLAMRIYNQDGGEVEACGNATRAVGLLAGGNARIATAAGVLVTTGNAQGIAVDMGEPRLGWEQIPLAYAMDTLAMPVGWDGLEQPVAVNVGNPHAVFFVPDCNAVPLDVLGPQIEHDPLFPARVNVNIATVVDRQTIRLRVWERGAGLTRACGTGACATAVAAMRRGLVEREVTVHLPGGALLIGWGADNRITMTGPATESFRGTFAWEDYG
ncbi:diaminopimelate epimerase [Alteraurantiacibacter buctensis]|uniref:Diaminopimelate epimerase n=1 Tax=Alteraurantiacibacter buctensis TaxID=1503981 RepID=A0A844YZN4_9SPHN|nr:diaminopimelate epimerase [Alteraurantiacibacter buctensis]MXO72476.1 diaminopimelate epimerase [Alteraurantiacibacter buctensis]